MVPHYQQHMQCSHVHLELGVSNCKSIVSIGLHVLVCCHIRTCYPLALCHVFMSLYTHLMGLL